MIYVALLRGINVGGNNRVEMARLKVCFENLSYTQVSTYINSGNVLFSSETQQPHHMVDSIEQSIEEQFGIRVPIVLRSQEDIANLCEATPDSWTNDAENRTDALFLWPGVKGKDMLELMKPRTNIDNYKIFDDVVVWHVKRSDSTKSGLHNLMGTKQYRQVTIRNINTVRKLNLLMQAMF